eukprot:5456516-Pyramimonas_sp.AAC.1
MAIATNGGAKHSRILPLNRACEKNRQWQQGAFGQPSNKRHQLHAGSNARVKSQQWQPAAGKTRRRRR